jgi:hypothetical protein
MAKLMNRSLISCEELHLQHSSPPLLPPLPLPSFPFLNTRNASRDVNDLKPIKEEEIDMKIPNEETSLLSQTSSQIHLPSLPSQPPLPSTFIRSTEKRNKNGSNIKLSR